LPDGTQVIVAEGEPATVALRRRGVVAVGTVTGASGIPCDAALRVLDRFDVGLWPDSDDAGKKHMARVGSRLTLLCGRSPARVAWPGSPPAGDAADFFASGGAAEDIADLIVAHEWATAQTPPHAGPVPPTFQRDPFPVHVFPEPARSFLEQVAASTARPPEMAALPFLAYAGAAIGNRKPIALKADWLERPILWTVVVAPPGSGKTPAQKAAMAPLLKLQRDEKPQPPALEHFYTVDATPEALTDIAASSPGLVINQDEVAGWVLSFDAYRKGGERQRHLSLWAGAPLKVDRATKKRPAFVEDPAISVTGGIQPDMLGALCEEAERRDGFLERFLWAVPHTEPAYWSTDTVDEATAGAMVQVFRELRYSAVRIAPDRRPEPVFLEPDAQQTWVTWYNECAELTRASHGLMSGMSAKLPIQCGRLALILHGLAHWSSLDRPVSLETVEAAIVLSEWFRQEAYAAFRLIAEAVPQPEAARRIKIVAAYREAAEGGLSRTDLQRITGRNLTAQELDELVEALVAEGIVEPMEPASSGQPGRPAIRHRMVDQNTRETRGEPTASESFFVTSFLRNASVQHAGDFECPRCGATEPDHTCAWDEV